MGGVARLDWIRESFAYDDWARERVLQLVGTLPSDVVKRDNGSSFGSILATLAHILESERVWLQRWTGESGPPEPENAATSVDEIRSRWAELARARWRFIERLTEADLDRPIHHRNSDGRTFAIPLGRLMRHVLNHSTYHRGQIATMVRQAGHQPVSTDLVRYFREAEWQDR